MGIFDFLRPTRPPRPPGGKQIEHLTAEEVAVWLQSQPRWRKLGTPLLTALARRLHGVPFATFWGACEMSGLDLSVGVPSVVDPDSDLSGLAGMMHLRGSAILESCQRSNPERERFVQQATIACLCYESAAWLFPDGLHHYGALAVLEDAVGGDYERVREFVLAASTRPREGGGPISEFTRQALRAAVAGADASLTSERLQTLAESLMRSAESTVENT